MKPGTVYFVGAPGRIKIGFTTNPEIRLLALRNADMEPLTVIASLVGERRHERAIHGRFAHLKIKNEWFRDCGELREYIAAVQRDGLETLPPEPQLGRRIRKPAADYPSDLQSDGRLGRALVEEAATIKRLKEFAAMGFWIDPELLEPTRWWEL